MIDWDDVRYFLAVARGGSVRAAAERLGVNRTTVAKWRLRFAAERLEGLGDAPRPGAARQIGDDVIDGTVASKLEDAQRKLAG